MCARVCVCVHVCECAARVTTPTSHSRHWNPGNGGEELRTPCRLRLRARCSVRCTWRQVKMDTGLKTNDAEVGRGKRRRPLCRAVGRAAGRSWSPAAPGRVWTGSAFEGSESVSKIEGEAEECCRRPRAGTGLKKVAGPGQEGRLAFQRTGGPRGTPGSVAKDRRPLCAPAGAYEEAPEAATQQRPDAGRNARAPHATGEQSAGPGGPGGPGGGGLGWGCPHHSVPYWTLSGPGVEGWTGLSPPLCPVPGRARSCGGSAGVGVAGKDPEGPEPGPGSRRPAVFPASSRCSGTHGGSDTPTHRTAARAVTAGAGPRHLPSPDGLHLSEKLLSQVYVFSLGRKSEYVHVKSETEILFLLIWLMLCFKNAHETSLVFERGILMPPVFPLFAVFIL